jgi:hypothetical protein
LYPKTINDAKNKNNYRATMVLDTKPEKNRIGISGRVAGPEVWRARIWHALRHLDDRSILNQSPLARLSYIQRLAESQFQGNALVRGLALKHVLITCVDKIIAELNSEPGLRRTCEFLQLIKQGTSVTTASKSLGLSREHVTRTYKKKAVELVAQEFLATVGHARLAQ